MAQHFIFVKKFFNKFQLFKYLPQIAHQSLLLAAPIAVFLRLAFVVEFFAYADAKQQFCDAFFIEIKLQGNDCIALALHHPLQAVYLFAVQ